MRLLPLLLLHQPTRGITMSSYLCDTCKKVRNSIYNPPVASEDGMGDVCPNCVNKNEVQEGHLEELRLQASEPLPLNGLGEE